MPLAFPISPLLLIFSSELDGKLDENGSQFEILFIFAFARGVDYSPFI